MEIRRHKHWGWGFEDQQPSASELQAMASGPLANLGIALSELEAPVSLEQLNLRPPRVPVPGALAEICASDDHARACHALGKSYSDVVRGFRGRFEHPPDFVAYPRGAHDVERVLEWCSDERVAAIPYGGGTSVVGGVTPEIAPSYNGAISVDLKALDRVLEVDQISRAALIQGGATGPVLEAQLAEHSLTLRHFPQSFEFSTLGGWIATRAAGHFATVWTHIEDFVESVSAITPAGVWASRRLPASGAGVSPDRMLAGSEGTLGLITEAWVRVQPRPSHRSAAGVSFESFLQGAECVRAISQSGLTRPTAACSTPPRPADDGRRRLACAAGARLRVHRPSRRAADGAGARAVRGARRRPLRERAERGSSDAVSSWREAFLGLPTCATRSSRWACWPRPSRRPSRGSASLPFMSA